MNIFYNGSSPELHSLGSFPRCSTRDILGSQLFRDCIVPKKLWKFLVNKPLMKFGVTNEHAASYLENDDEMISFDL